MPLFSLPSSKYTFMIDYFKSKFAPGDPLEITTDTETVRGKVEFIGPDYIVLRLPDNRITGISEAGIRTFTSIPEADLQQHTAEEESREMPLPTPQTPTAETVPTQSRFFKSYKPGERVPLSVLTERDPSLISDWHKKNETKKKSNIAIEGIRKAYDEAKEAHRSEDKTMVTANGKIVKLRPSYQFGFIDTADGKRYFFNRADLVDRNLWDFTGEEIEVAYLPSSNHKGLAAKAIVRPQPVDGILDIVMERATDGDIAHAKALLRMLADRLPNNKSVASLLEALDQALGKDEAEEQDEAEAYREGNAHLENKEFEAAIECFKESIRQEQKKDQSIKQIITTYIRMYTSSEDLEEREKLRQTTLDFINEMRSALPNQISSLFVLENAYFALGDYASHIDVVEEVINYCAKKRDISKYLFYLKKASQSYFRLGEFTRALDTAQEGLERYPDDEQLLHLRDMAQDELNVRLQ